MPTLQIHPSIGVARIGNSEEFFIGPEQPGIPEHWNLQTGKFDPFRDARQRILRQAARFRICQFDDNGIFLKELTLADGIEIEWRVHVANRKASFFSFNGQSGAETFPPYAGRASRPGTDIEKKRKGRGRPEVTNRRNALVTDRRSLEIDPGPVPISAPGFRDLIDIRTAAPINALGRIEMQLDGRLLILGGFGRTASNQNPSTPIEEYANNDGWFDDMCDGTVEATVTFPDGHKENVVPAWIIVGPPKFAPGLRHVVTLYDTLWDLAVRFGLECRPGNDPVLQDLRLQQTLWRNPTNDFDPQYEPSFVAHIYPLLSRALAARDTHEPPPTHPGYHASLPDWLRLSKRDEPQFREAVFRRIRNPNSDKIDYQGMPRGLGDDFKSLDDFENEEAPAPSPRAFVSVTRVQYALLKAWSEGRFKEDWNFGDVKYPPIPTQAPVTPHGLDIAALENCVGGPFFPGIEVSWLIRQPQLYQAAFRLHSGGSQFGPLHFGAGFFSQQMALPWQADFYDCHKEDHTPEGAAEPIIYMWWTAQRPDDIRAIANGPYRRWVSAFDGAKETNAKTADDLSNLARFEQMRTRWPELSFVVLEGDQFIEEKRV